MKWNCWQLLPCTLSAVKQEATSNHWLVFQTIWYLQHVNYLTMIQENGTQEFWEAPVTGGRSRWSTPCGNRLPLVLCGRWDPNVGSWTVERVKGRGTFQIILTLHLESPLLRAQMYTITHHTGQLGNWLLDGRIVLVHIFILHWLLKQCVNYMTY